MARTLLGCLAGAVVMAVTLACADVMAANTNIGAPRVATLLTQAEQAWPIDESRFRGLLEQLHQPGEQLTARQQWHLRLLDAISLWIDGDIGKTDPVLDDIIDHSGDQALSVRATAILIQSKFTQHDYADAYALANTLMVELPKVTDPTAHMEGMAQVIAMLNQRAVGQYGLALQYARQMKVLFPSARGQCLADTFEAKSMQAGTALASTDPRFQQAIDACLAAGRPLDADALRLDLASVMIDEGHADRAIAFLHRMASAVRKSSFPPYVASWKLTLAQAYLSLGDAPGAREFALDSIAVKGASGTLWIQQAAYDVLYKAENMSGHAAAALAYYKKYVALDKTAMDDAKARALAYQMVRQQVQAKKMKLDALSKQNSILQLRQALAVQAQKTSRLFNVLLLVVLAFIALAMFWLKRSQLRFRRMARHDGLTGAFNREHFFEEANRTLRRLHKAKAGVCLVVLDLDHFKQVNDTYGHAVGDEVLQRTVELCRRELRGSDVFGRLGGEEFGILMPACSREQGIEIATRTGLTLASTAMVLNSQATIKVSASFGLACSASSDRTLHQLLREADLALYRAKGAGRNQVNAGVDMSAIDQAGAGAAVGV